jgi:glycosyltransferase involved in cell wall biosynthesis
VDGLVVEDPDDVAGLAEALGSLADPATRNTMGEQARQTALKYSWEQPLERTLAIYRELTGAQPRLKSHRAGVGI